MQKTTKLTEAEIQSLRRQVALRDNYKCILCGNPASHIHHIIYRSHALTNSPKVWQEKNMASLCLDCHWDCHKYPKEMRQRLFQRMIKLYGYSYDDQPFAQYLVEGET